MVYWPVDKEIPFIDISMLNNELNILINFDRRHYEEHLVEIILNLGQLFRRRDHLKLFLIYSSGSLFVQCLQTICAIMVVGLMLTISVKQYLIWNSGSRGNAVKDISYLKL